MALKHIRSQIPEFAVPPYEGDRYEDLVPDTLDIAERASLAVNGLTGPTDPELDHMLYFNASFRTNPPVMWHRGSDICQTKFEESLPLMRTVSGSHLNAQVDRTWMENALHQIGEDGLFYWPFFPWVEAPDWGIGYCTDRKTERKADFYSLPIFCGRRIGAMTVYLLRDPSGPWDAAARRIVDGLRGVAIDRDDWAYFPQGEFYPGVPRARDAAVPVGIWSSLPGWTAQGLAQYYRASGYEPARDLAGKLARYIAFHGRFYGARGEFLPNYAGEDGGRVEDRDGVQGFHPGPENWREYTHFHHHLIPLLGILEYALVAEDRELAEFVRRSFEWARTKGNLTIGYFPENIDRVNDLQTSELCEVADMIALALKLSAAGLGDYWDDADCWIRNLLAEGQLLRTDWCYRLGSTGPVRPDASFDPKIASCDKVPERCLGAFAGWPMPNDWGWGIMHCCTGNSTRALYYAWERILSLRAGTLSVNLLLNRAAPWADLDSHLPYAGQVDLAIKQPCRIRVRMPPWARPRDVRCLVNGSERELGWEGRYALCGSAATNDRVSVLFPIGERTVEADIEKRHYSLVVRASEVVSISPQGEHCPLFQRDYYRTNVTRWRKIERFVPRHALDW